ncbi:hypothetical protein H4K34_15920 [Croceimicrobium hydrocarbonivorans]|uniref:DUF3828 domain-containing protein n=1 Tax=Croceimicrobium hydrocarbonivorans TaxID=2761580 RepID=A0A7H0VK43_9FLAO|nr:hypothetical protein H4K34_15920 [Croceimicrobium hydrocarbonivorans]
MRNLAILFVVLTMFSCQTTGSKNESSEAAKTQQSEPNFEAALKFINDYLDFINGPKSELAYFEWLDQRNDVTLGFKNELKRIIDEAERADPEYGLGFDPILDAQDSPDEFVLDTTDSEYLTVKGKDWPDFKLTLKVKLVNEKWLVEGSGIINIPENKRIER